MQCASLIAPNELGLYRYQLGYREPTLMVTLIFVAVMTVLLIATGAWRKAFPGLF